MKNTVSLLFVVLFNLSFVFAQQSDDIKKQIDEKVKAMDDGIASYTSKKYNKTFEGNSDLETTNIYFKDTQLMKIEVSLSGVQGVLSSQYYYSNNQVFFIYCYRGNGTMFEEADFEYEDQFYFDKNHLILWIGNDNSPVDKNSSGYTEQEKIMQKEAGELYLKYKK